jgi:large conductance mechanosensitive channel
MGFAKEFKEFALKGNVVDLAVAVVIGAAFGAIITSLVDDVVTPIILKPLLNRAHITDLKELIWHGVRYGSFIASILNFIIVALALFMVIRSMNAMKRRKEAPATVESAPNYTLQEKLLMEIRDSVKK